MENFQCFCGDDFSTREELIAHNVEAHDMNEGESRRTVLEKYPEQA